MVDHELLTKVTLLKRQAVFAELPRNILEKLASHLKQQRYKPNEIIVNEGELADSIYFIQSGYTEVWVTPEGVSDEHLRLIAKLGPNETIGLSKSGLYSQSGERTATVITVSDLRTYQLMLEDLYRLQQQYPEILKSAKKALTLIHRINFAKKLLPFRDLSVKQLQEFTHDTMEVNEPAGHEIFHENDVSEQCYFITKGSVEVLNSSNQKIAILKENDVFGETGIILNLPRNATIKTLTPCEFLVLKSKDLLKILRKHQHSSLLILSLIRSRTRPTQSKDIEIYQQQNSLAGNDYLLKNTANKEIYALSEEGLYLWNQINGINDITQIEKNFSKRYKNYSSASITNFIMDLADYDFVTLKGFTTAHHKSMQNYPWWLRTLKRIPKLMEVSINFPNVDEMLARTLPWFRWFFSKTAQVILGSISLVGFLLFIKITPTTILLLHKTPVHYLWLLYPLFIVTLTLHEFSHAYATKYFGAHVRAMGVSWFWFGPAAFCDTTDTLLSSRRVRLLVNAVGVYTQSICAGIAGWIAYFSHSSAVVSFAWLFALINYFNIIMNLDPIIDLDGYYLLEDLTCEPNLRGKAVNWVSKASWKNLGSVSFWKNNPAAFYYWSYALIFNVLILPLIWWFQLHVLGVYFTIFQSIYVRIIITVGVFVLSTLSTWAEIRAAGG